MAWDESNWITVTSRLVSFNSKNKTCVVHLYSRYFLHFRMMSTTQPLIEVKEVMKNMMTKGVMMMMWMKVQHTR